jgi:hypothetical protein
MFVSLGLSGCSGSRSADGIEAQAVQFVPAPEAMDARCRATAAAVGYAVPCLARIPHGFTHFQQVAFIGPGSGAWRTWAIGSTDVFLGPRLEHLVVTASPRALQNDAKVVNGPAWYRGARVKPMKSVVVNGRPMHAVFVPQMTNDGSAFAHHVVLIWTARGHTYGFGFHDILGIRKTLALDEEFVRHVKLVR